MVLTVLRALFILLMAAVGWYFVGDKGGWFLGNATWLTMALALAVGVFFLCVDILSPRRKLAIFSGTFFGLMVGILIAYGLSFVVNLLVDQWQPAPPPQTRVDDPVAIKDANSRRELLDEYINMMIGVTSCYLSISFILQTKDDFRFIIPYVEFVRQTKGPRPIVLDTSVLIDGRIADVIDTGLVESQLIVPKFVINELQMIADGHDRLRRNRGRRGLDVVRAMQANPHAEVVLYDASNAPSSEHENDVDHRVLALASELDARVLTNDLNLNKVATLRGVQVINVHDLANALKPVVMPGERMSVRLLKPGEEANQGVGYLDDGTMVVVEHGRAHLNQEVEFVVTNIVQTSAGKMIFGRIGESTAAGAPRRVRGAARPEAAAPPRDETRSESATPSN